MILEIFFLIIFSGKNIAGQKKRHSEILNAENQLEASAFDVILKADQITDIKGLN